MYSRGSSNRNYSTIVVLTLLSLTGSQLTMVKWLTACSPLRDSLECASCHVSKMKETLRKQAEKRLGKRREERTQSVLAFFTRSRLIALITMMSHSQLSRETLLAVVQVATIRDFHDDVIFLQLPESPSFFLSYLSFEIPVRFRLKYP